MKHTTNNLEERAADIADRETKDCPPETYFCRWERAYDSALLELSSIIKGDQDGR